MKRLILILSILISLATISSPVYAADVFHNCGAGSANGTPDVCSSVNDQNNNNSTDPIITVLKTAIGIVSYLTGALAVIFIMVGAIQYITSGGDTNAVSTARSSITYALIGIIVTILAQSIIVFVLNRIK